MTKDHVNRMWDTFGWTRSYEDEVCFMLANMQSAINTLLRKLISENEVVNDYFWSLFTGLFVYASQVSALRGRDRPSLALRNPGKSKKNGDLENKVSIQFADGRFNIVIVLG